MVSIVNYTTRIEGPMKFDTIVWTIPNFSKVLEDKTKEIRTENYNDTISSLVSSRFQLKMQFLGRHSELTEIYYVSPNPVLIKLVVNVCLTRFKDRTIATKDFHTVQAKQWQYLMTLFKQDVLITSFLASHDKAYLNDDSLTLEYMFTVIQDVQINQHIRPDAPLNSDLENMLNNGLYSDITIKSVEGKDFNVHKAVLAGRSVVFKAHFEHNTIECLTNIIETKLEADVLRELLHFIYTDMAPGICEKPEKLLAAAEYYQLSKLKHFCEEALHKNLTVENAIETLELADLHSANLLKQLTLEFIKDDQVKLILKTEGWAKIQSLEMIKTIFEYVMNDDIEGDFK